MEKNPSRCQAKLQVESICGLIPGTVKPLALSMFATWRRKSIS